ncbi:MAG: 5'-methylthioadenosine/S-adenosylhomocysteine nucleosidase [Anaerolineae bacterium]
MKILIVTPLQKELNFFLQGCAMRGFQTQNSVVGRLPVVQIPDLDLTLAQGGAGKAQFAVQTQHLLDTCTNRDVVVCAGAAGGLVNDLGIGDVVVATTTVEHDYNNKFNERPVPRFDGAPGAIAALKRVSAALDSFKVHFGTVASGDEDVVDAARRQTIHQSTGGLAVAWEGAGGARACAFNDVPFVEIRGITDAADHDAPSAFETNLEAAMHNIATLITSWIKSKQERRQ